MISKKEHEINQNKKGMPHYPENGILRLYNMFPFRHYSSGEMGIKDMTDYVSNVAEMGFNAIWINPLQKTGTLKFPHPDGCTKASGSLYAMTDDNALNPLIFPVSPSIDDHNFRETQLGIWTQTVRTREMFPLFDLVLNHIGLDEGQDAPLTLKLKKEGEKRNLKLLLSDINERWPDIQGLDYYQDNLAPKKRGLNAEPKDLDFEKIAAIFEILWEPLITRYIKQYGFMGMRVDAVTHIPVPVHQRAIELVQKLVREIYHTDAVIVGELMIGNTESYIPSLNACGFTHCMNPHSYFWGPNKEGGYSNDRSNSSFIKQNEQLPGAIFTATRPLFAFKKLVILDEILDKKIKYQENTMYIFKDHTLALNANERDIYFDKALILSLKQLKIDNLSKYIEDYHGCTLLIEATSKKLNASKKSTAAQSEGNKNIEDEKKYLVDNQKKLRAQQIDISNILLIALQNSELLKQAVVTHSNSLIQRGGLIAVVGNHDVGTLKAKIMLDAAYSRAIAKANQDPLAIQIIENTYKQFKQATIKGIRNTPQLIEQLRKEFKLTDSEVNLLFLELNMRMREKMFIQSMMCIGGWYLLGGDEFGVCHKPEVFSEFAQSKYVGPSLIECRDSTNQQHDFRGFIGGINHLLNNLPPSSYQDKTSLHCVVLSKEVMGEKPKPADSLFMVLRYNANTQRHYLMGHCGDPMNVKLLSEKIHHVLTGIPQCEIHIIDTNGSICSFDFERNTGITARKNQAIPADQSNSYSIQTTFRFFTNRLVFPASEMPSKSAEEYQAKV